MDNNVKKLMKTLVKDEFESIFFATVEEVKNDGEYLTIKTPFGNIIQGVKSIASGTSGGILFTPKIKSDCIILRFGKNYYAMGFSKLEEVKGLSLMGSDNGGLVKVKELTEKLNNLEAYVKALADNFNIHTHNVTTSGSATTQTGITISPNKTFTKLYEDIKRADIENDSVQH